VLATALQLVDEQGLGKLSMRRLGEALGVEAMSLYRYVTHKQDLLDGVHGAVLDEVVPPESSADWEARLRALSHAFRDALMRHPKTLPLFATRPAVAPSSLSLVDAALGILDEAGLPADEQLGALHALVAFIVGSCQAYAAWDDPEQPEVDYAALPAAYSNLRRLAPQIAVEDPDLEFAQGLELWIAGLRTRLR